MALTIRPKLSSKLRLTTILIAVFALMAQPIYGFVASQVVNAVVGLTYTDVAFAAGEWSADRRFPTGGINVVSGGNGMDVGFIPTQAATPVTHPSNTQFYKTEGVKRSLPNSISVKSHIGIYSGVAAVDNYRGGLWVTSTSDTPVGTDPLRYPIIEYANKPLDNTGYTGWRVYNTFTGSWVNIAGPSITTGLNSYEAEITYNSGTNSFDFYLDGTLRHSYASQDGYDTFNGVILNVFNPGSETDANSYLTQYSFLKYAETPVIPTVPATSETIMVNQANLNGWTLSGVNGGTAEFKATPDAPSGDGVLNLLSDSTNPARASASRSENIRLNELSNLSYKTKQNAANTSGGNASYRISFDADGNLATTNDTATLIFEPYWQNAGSPDPAPVVPGTWQTWDVTSGLFWASIPGGNSVTGLTHGAGGPPLYTLADVIALHPNAITTVVGVGIGTYNPEYDIEVDDVTIGTSNLSVNHTVSYNFEPTAPDTEAPIVTITSPANGAVVNGTIDVLGMVTDNEALSHYTMYLYPGSTNLAGGGVPSGSISVPGWGSTNTSANHVDVIRSLDTSALVEGEYQIRLAARDAAGNRDTSDVYSPDTSSVHVIRFTVDRTLPTAPVITAPGANTWHRTAPIVNSWTAATDTNGIAKYQVAYRYHDDHSFGGSTCAGEMIGGFNVYCRDTNGLSRNHSPELSEQGGVTIWVRAIDNAGNTGPWSAPRSYTYDAAAPVTTIAVSTPVDGTFTVSGNAGDNIRLNRVYVQLVSRVTHQRCGGTTIHFVADNTNAASWSVDYDLATLGADCPEGEFAAHVEVVDMAGNRGTAGWTDNFLVLAPVVTEPEEPGTEEPTDPETEVPTGPTNPGESIPSGEGQPITPFAAPGFPATIPPLAFNNTPNAENQDSNNNSGNNSNVLGEQDTATGTPLADTGEVLGIMDNKFFGLLWYWWLIVLGALVGGWLLIAAAIRRRREDEE